MKGQDKPDYSKELSLSFDMSTVIKEEAGPAETENKVNEMEEQRSEGEPSSL